MEATTPHTRHAILARIVALGSLLMAKPAPPTRVKGSARSRAAFERFLAATSGVR
jgi:hypothetical protein